jgi:uncharacterized protein YjbI with pentapeptide repeats
VTEETGVKEHEGKQFESIQFTEDIRMQEYTDCRFAHCRFADIALTDVVFRNCEFEDCTFRNVDVSGLRMQNTVLLSSACVGMDWSEVRALGRLFPLFREIRNSTLKLNNFFKMKLPKLHIAESQLLDCAFMECTLTESTFHKVDFQNTTFQDCDLSKSDFREAKNYKLNTESNRVAKAKFSLPEVVGLLDNLNVIIE